MLFSVNVCEFFVRLVFFCMCGGLFWFFLLLFGSLVVVGFICLGFFFFCVEAAREFHRLIFLPAMQPNKVKGAFNFPIFQQFNLI